MTSERKVNYVEGVNRATIKKIAQFWFGQKAVVDVKHDDAHSNFVVILNKKAETQDWQIIQFKEFWKVRVSQIE